MPALQIRHRTIYRYHHPVTLHAHRLMVRPRESRDLRIVEMSLKTQPEASVTWARDVADNCVATAAFPGLLVGELVIESEALVELKSVAWPVFPVAVSALEFPFRYSDSELADLGALAVPMHQDDGGLLRSWVEGFVLGRPTDTLALLKDLNAGISAQLAYQSRDDEGTQSPLQTLALSRGSCRDFAVLLADSARTLGLGARIVSGYLHRPGESMSAIQGGGSTHAWAEIYVPGAGWITFDPTNGNVGGANLIPVAVGRDIASVIPVSGSFGGPSNAFAGLQVDVSVQSPRSRELVASGQ